MAITISYNSIIFILNLTSIFTQCITSTTKHSPCFSDKKGRPPWSRTAAHLLTFKFRSAACLFDTAYCACVDSNPLYIRVEHEFVYMTEQKYRKPDTTCFNFNEFIWFCITCHLTVSLLSEYKYSFQTLPVLSTAEVSGSLALYPLFTSCLPRKCLVLGTKTPRGQNCLIISWMSFTWNYQCFQQKWLYSKRV